MNMKFSILMAAVIGMFAVGAIVDKPVTKIAKTIPISQELYVEMRHELEKNGKYLFCDHDIAIVITNTLHEVEQPMNFQRKPWVQKGSSTNKDSKAVKPYVEPFPYLSKNSISM